MNATLCQQKMGGNEIRSFIPFILKQNNCKKFEAALLRSKYSVKKTLAIKYADPF